MKNKNFKKVLKSAIKYYKEKGFFNYGDLGKELVKTGRSFDLAGRYLRKLREEGTIEKIKYGTYVIKQTNRN